MKNLCKLVNYHESFLNSAVYSYENGIVSDWITFLREDWAQILFHDKFKDFVNKLKKMIQNDKGVISIVDKVFEIADSSPDDSFVEMSRRKIFGERCENLLESTRKSVESFVIEFIKENKHMLPRYYIPQLKISK